MIYDKTGDYESGMDKVKAMHREQAPSGSATINRALNNDLDRAVPQSLLDMIQEAIAAHDRAFTFYWEATHQLNHAREVFEAADNRLQQLVTEYFNRDTPESKLRQR